MSLLCCGSSGGAEISAEDKARSKALDSALKKEKEVDDSVIKMLLLGAGESGKSTVFKQMKVINSAGYSKEERASFKSIIHSNTIQSMKAILAALEKIDLSITEPAEAVEAIETIQNLNMNSELDTARGGAVKTLWTHPVIQQAFERRSEFQLNDSADYYFNKLDEITQPDYLPSEQDVLRSRVRTTGIVESDFKIKSVNFKMFDVGGQRNERRKWIHCFEDVHAVVFVASMSEYDQNLYEDETQNRMIEALNLFEQICNSKWFRDTSMILFLNKKDLFEQKIQSKDMTGLWPDYTGGLNYENGSQFIKNKFLALNKPNPDNNKTKAIYCHFTCATNTDNIAFVFDSVVQIILDQNMAASGLG